MDNVLRETEAEGKTREEALESALKTLNPGKNERYEVEVLKQGKNGFLGLIGGTPTRVKVSVIKDETAIAAEEAAESDETMNAEEAAAGGRAFIEKIMHLAELEGGIEFNRQGKTLNIEVDGDDVGLLIGRRGQTLNAIQHLLNVMINRRSRDRLRIRFNVAGYRQNRETALKELAGKLASTVKNKGKKVELEPMRPYERRAIHVALKDDEAVHTYSKGEEPYRKVVISKKKSK